MTPYSIKCVGKGLAVAAGCGRRNPASIKLRADGLKERIAWQLERMEGAASRKIARGTGVLATIGATAPFVGLFGTVWGIMDSFIGISRAHTTNLAISCATELLPLRSRSWASASVLQLARMRRSL